MHVSNSSSTKALLSTSSTHHAISASPLISSEVQKLCPLKSPKKILLTSLTNKELLGTDSRLALEKMGAFPQLTQEPLSALVEMLTIPRNIKVVGTTKNGTNIDITLTITWLELFHYLQKQSQASKELRIKDIFLFGSQVPHVLSRFAEKLAQTLLSDPNYQLDPSLLRQFKGIPADTDFKATIESGSIESFNIYKKFFITFISEKACLQAPEISLKEMQEIVLQGCFHKCSVPQAFYSDAFATFSLQDSNKKVSEFVISEQSEQCALMQDDLSLSLSPIVNAFPATIFEASPEDPTNSNMQAKLDKAKEELLKHIKEGVFQPDILSSTKGNLWQICLDLITGTLRLPDQATLTTNRWPRMLRKCSRGKTPADAATEQAAFASQSFIADQWPLNQDSLPKALYQKLQKLDKESPNPSYIEKWVTIAADKLERSFAPKNSQEFDSLIAILCQASASLKRLEKTDYIAPLWKIMGPVIEKMRSNENPNAPKTLWGLIYEVMKSSPEHYDTLMALLEIKAFLHCACELNTEHLSELNINLETFLEAPIFQIDNGLLYLFLPVNPISAWERLSANLETIKSIAAFDEMREFLPLKTAYKGNKTSKLGSQKEALAIDYKSLITCLEKKQLTENFPPEWKKLVTESLLVCHTHENNPILWKQLKSWMPSLLKTAQNYPEARRLIESAINGHLINENKSSLCLSTNMDGVPPQMIWADVLLNLCSPDDAEIDVSTAYQIWTDYRKLLSSSTDQSQALDLNQELQLMQKIGSHKPHLLIPMYDTLSKEGYKTPQDQKLAALWLLSAFEKCDPKKQAHVCESFSGLLSNETKSAFFDAAIQIFEEGRHVPLLTSICVAHTPIAEAFIQKLISNAPAKDLDKIYKLWTIARNSSSSPVQISQELKWMQTIATHKPHLLIPVYDTLSKDGYKTPEDQAKAVQCLLSIFDKSDSTNQTELFRYFASLLSSETKNAFFESAIHMVQESKNISQYLPLLISLHISDKTENLTEDKLLQQLVADVITKREQAPLSLLLQTAKVAIEAKWIPQAETILLKLITNKNTDQSLLGELVADYLNALTTFDDAEKLLKIQTFDKLLPQDPVKALKALLHLQQLFLSKNQPLTEFAQTVLRLSLNLCKSSQTTNEKDYIACIPLIQKFLIEPNNKKSALKTSLQNCQKDLLDAFSKQLHENSEREFCSLFFQFINKIMLNGIDSTHANKALRYLNTHLDDKDLIQNCYNHRLVIADLLKDEEKVSFFIQLASALEKTDIKDKIPDLRSDIDLLLKNSKINEMQKIVFVKSLDARFEKYAKVTPEKDTKENEQTIVLKKALKTYLESQKSSFKTICLKVSKYPGNLENIFKTLPIIAEFFEEKTRVASASVEEISNISFKIAHGVTQDRATIDAMQKATSLLFNVANDIAKDVEFFKQNPPQLEAALKIWSSLKNIFYNCFDEPKKFALAAKIGCTDVFMSSLEGSTDKFDRALAKLHKFITNIGPQLLKDSIFKEWQPIVIRQLSEAQYSSYCTTLARSTTTIVKEGKEARKNVHQFLISLVQDLSLNQGIQLCKAFHELKCKNSLLCALTIMEELLQTKISGKTKSKINQSEIQTQIIPLVNELLKTALQDEYGLQIKNAARKCLKARLDLFEREVMQAHWISIVDAVIHQLPDPELEKSRLINKLEKLVAMLIEDAYLFAEKPEQLLERAKNVLLNLFIQSKLFSTLAEEFYTVVYNNLVKFCKDHTALNSAEAQLESLNLVNSAQIDLLLLMMTTPLKTASQLINMCLFFEKNAGFLRIFSLNPKLKKEIVYRIPVFTLLTIDDSCFFDDPSSNSYKIYQNTLRKLFEEAKPLLRKTPIQLGIYLLLLGLPPEDEDWIVDSKKSFTPDNKLTPQEIIEAIKDSSKGIFNQFAKHHPSPYGYTSFFRIASLINNAQQNGLLANKYTIYLQELDKLKIIAQHYVKNAPVFKQLTQAIADDFCTNKHLNADEETQRTEAVIQWYQQLLDMQHSHSIQAAFALLNTVKDKIPGLPPEIRQFLQEGHIEESVPATDPQEKSSEKYPIASLQPTLQEDPQATAIETEFRAYLERIGQCPQPLFLQKVASLLNTMAEDLTCNLMLAKQEPEKLSKAIEIWFALRNDYMKRLDKEHGSLLTAQLCCVDVVMHSLLPSTEEFGKALTLLQKFIDQSDAQLFENLLFNEWHVRQIFENRPEITGKENLGTPGLETFFSSLTKKVSLEKGIQICEAFQKIKGRSSLARALSIADVLLKKKTTSETVTLMNKLLSAAQNPADLLESIEKCLLPMFTSLKPFSQKLAESLYGGISTKIVTFCAAHTKLDIEKVREKIDHLVMLGRIDLLAKMMEVSMTAPSQIICLSETFEKTAQLLSICWDKLDLKPQSYNTELKCLMQKKFRGLLGTFLLGDIDNSCFIDNKGSGSYAIYLKTLQGLFKSVKPWLKSKDLNVPLFSLILGIPTEKQDWVRALTQPRVGKNLLTSKEIVDKIINACGQIFSRFEAPGQHQDSYHYICFSRIATLLNTAQQTGLFANQYSAYLKEFEKLQTIAKACVDNPPVFEALTQAICESFCNHKNLTTSEKKQRVDAIFKWHNELGDLQTIHAIEAAFDLLINTQAIMIGDR